MVVIGGTYKEYCLNPYRNRIMGSGLRAACALSGLDSDICLVSAIDDEMRETADLTAGSYSISIKWEQRNKPVCFNYFTPLFSPQLYGHDSMADNIRVTNCQVALVYEMIETKAEIEADFIVIDPQQSYNTMQLESSNYKCKNLAIVANASETVHLGEDENIAQAAKNIMEKYSASVVVTKQGAVGSLITSPQYQRAIGPNPTNRVMPIGSGDVFSAIFAFAWAQKGADPVEAARVASAATAYYVSTETLPISEEVFSCRELLNSEIASSASSVYLAGPFFNLPELWFIDKLYRGITELGANVFSPFHCIGKGGIEVAQKDLAGLGRCTSVLALLDNLDAGTVFEVGWAIKSGIPVVGYSSVIKDEANKMFSGSGVEWHTDLSTAVYRSIWKGMGHSR